MSTRLCPPPCNPILPGHGIRTFYTYWLDLRNKISWILPLLQRYSSLIISILHKLGAGVVGLAVARSLAMAGKEVLILDRASAICTGELDVLRYLARDRTPSCVVSSLIQPLFQLQHYILTHVSLRYIRNVIEKLRGNPCWLILSIEIAQGSFLCGRQAPPLRILQVAPDPLQKLWENIGCN